MSPVPSFSSREVTHNPMERVREYLRVPPVCFTLSPSPSLFIVSTLVF